MLSHAEKCRKAAEECEQAARYLRAMADGNKQAADDLDRMCNHLPYEGDVLMVRVDELIAALSEDNDE